MKRGVSMLWRTLLVIATALLLSEVIAVVLLGEYVSKPQAARRTEQFVGHLKTIGAALETMGDPDEAQFIRRIREREGVVIERAASPEPLPGMAPARDPRLRVFPQRVQEVFGRNAALYVRDDEGAPNVPMLWAMLPLRSDENYWVGFPVERIEPLSLSGMMLWTGAGLLISLAAASLIVWRLARPLDVLAAAANAMGGERVGGSPLPERGPAEIRAVARAFNSMKERLLRNDREKAAFLAGVSHDLRTPLGHLRLETAMLRNRIDTDTYASMVGDMDEMNAIIDQFIDYVRSEASEAPEPVDLSRLVRECTERWTRNDIAIRSELAELPRIALRPLAMQRLVNNLVANAIRHAGHGIEVRTALGPDAVVLSVCDRGPGIPPAMVDHLKEPFTRMDEARSGSSGAGLGLAIADRIARLHGGRLDLVNREGGGLEARVTLPLA